MSKSLPYAVLLPLLIVASSAGDELTTQTIGRIHAASLATKWACTITDSDTLAQHGEQARHELEADWLQPINRGDGIALGYSDGRAILAVPGTADRVQLRIQQDSSPAEILNGNSTGHRGFALSAGTLTPELLELLKTNEVTDLIVTGFSAGAAIASYAAFNLFTSDDPVARQLDTATIVTFGSPRATTPRIRRLLGKTANRIRLDVFEILTLKGERRIDPVSLAWINMLKNTGDRAAAAYISGLGHPLMIQIPRTAELHSLATYLAGIERLKELGPQPSKKRHVILLTND